MKKYAVGDVVMVPVKILEVHEQGFKYGVHANGAPNMPPHQNPTAEELAEAKKEQPATIIASTPDSVSFDSLGRAHFKSDAAL